MQELNITKDVLKMACITYQSCDGHNFLHTDTELSEPKLHFGYLEELYAMVRCTRPPGQASGRPAKFETAQSLT